MSTHEDRLEEWLDIRARKHRGPGVEIKIKKSRRPRVVREIPKDRRLLVELPLELMARLKGFVALPPRSTAPTTGALSVPLPRLEPP